MRVLPRTTCINRLDNEGRLATNDERLIQLLSNDIKRGIVKDVTIKKQTQPDDKNGGLGDIVVLKSKKQDTVIRKNRIPEVEDTKE